MKTIEEKALEKAEKYYDEDRELRNLDSFYDGYIQGVAEALQSQWRSAGTELPEWNQAVLIAYKATPTSEIDYCVGYHNRQWHSVDECIDNGEILAWLPIPKYESDKVR